MKIVLMNSRAKEVTHRQLHQRPDRERGAAAAIKGTLDNVIERERRVSGRIDLSP